MFVPTIATLLSLGSTPLTPLPAACSPQGKLTLGHVDRAAAVLQAPESVQRPFGRSWDRTKASVRLRFVVGCDGKVEQSSFGLISATDSAYSLAAVAFVQSIRFTPATVAGVPVRQLVDRKVVWLKRGATEVIELHSGTPGSDVGRKVVRSVVPSDKRQTTNAVASSVVL